LFPIFKKKVVSKYQIYPLLESHTAKKIRWLFSWKWNSRPKQKLFYRQQAYRWWDMYINKLSSLIEKPLLEKGDLSIKHDDSPDHDWWLGWGKCIYLDYRIFTKFILDHVYNIQLIFKEIWSLY
jgi:hypothetical protein